MRLDDELKEFAQDWHAADGRVNSRRAAWEQFIANDLWGRLDGVAQILSTAGIPALRMGDRVLGSRRLGIRLDTRRTGLVVETADGAKSAVRETFADFAFSQQPSGLVWVLGWQPHFPELTVKTPAIYLFRDFDPTDQTPSLQDAVSNDIMVFLRWALAHSFRGTKLIHGPKSLELELEQAARVITGFKPFAEENREP